MSERKIPIYLECGYSIAMQVLGGKWKIGVRHHSSAILAPARLALFFVYIYKAKNKASRPSGVSQAVTKIALIILPHGCLLCPSSHFRHFA